MTEVNNKSFNSRIVDRALVNKISGSAYTRNRNEPRLMWSYMKFRKTVHCRNFYIVIYNGILYNKRLWIIQ